MVISHSYVSLPEGNINGEFFTTPQKKMDFASDASYKRRIIPLGVFAVVPDRGVVPFLQWDIIISEPLIYMYDFITLYNHIL